jgi:hypothetical protein
MRHLLEVPYCPEKGLGAGWFQPVHPLPSPTPGGRWLSHTTRHEAPVFHSVQGRIDGP